MLKKLWNAAKTLWNKLTDIDLPVEPVVIYGSPNKVSVSQRNWNEYAETLRAIERTEEYLRQQEKVAQGLSPEAIQSWRENNARVSEVFARKNRPALRLVTNA